MRVRDEDTFVLSDPLEFRQLTLVENYNAPDVLMLDGQLAQLAPGIIPGSGCVVTDEAGELRFSGRLFRVERRADKTGSLVYHSDTARLWERFTYPVPANDWTTAGQTSAYDVRTGPAETRLLGYISYNLGPLARTERETTNLVIPASGGRGPSATTSARGHNLGVLTMALAESADLRLEIVHVLATGNLLVQLTDVPDMSAAIRFGTGDYSGPGFLGEDSSYALEAPGASVVLSAAGGQGKDRILNSLQNSTRETLWNRRVERFADMRNIGAQIGALADKNKAALGEANALREKNARLRDKNLASNLLAQAQAYLDDHPGNAGAISRRDDAQARYDDALSAYNDSVTEYNTAVTDSNNADTAYTTAVAQDADEIADGMADAMAEATGLTEINIQIMSSPEFVIGTDVPIGAKATAVFDGLVLVNRIRQITTVLGGDGATKNVSAVFGSPDVALTPSQRQLTAALKRIANQERT